MTTTKPLTKAQIKANQQAAVNKVYRHFVVNRHSPGWNKEEDICCNTTPEGYTCAVGCLMTPQERQKIPKDIPRRIEDEYGGLFALRFRRVHDNAADRAHFESYCTTLRGFSKHFKANLKALCKDYKLVYPGDMK